MPSWSPATPSGRISGLRSWTGRWRSTPAGRDASVAEVVLLDRARSAAILVPPLLVVMWLGGWAIVIVVGLAVAIAAWEAFRLLTAAGHVSMPLLGITLAVIGAVGDAVDPVAGASGLLLAALGIVLDGIGALTRLDPREGLAV